MAESDAAESWWCCPDFTTLPCTDPHCDIGTLLCSYSPPSSDQAVAAASSWPDTTAKWTTHHRAPDGEICCDDRACAPQDTLIPSSSTSSSSSPTQASSSTQTTAPTTAAGEQEDHDDCACCAAGCPPEPAAAGEADACPECASTEQQVGDDEAAIQELLKCCCCGDETSPASFPTHHLTTHPSHDLGNALPSFLFHPAPDRSGTIGQASSPPFALGSPRPSSSAPPPPPAQLFPCEWAGCHGFFPSRDALAAHVNSAHLVPRPSHMHGAPASAAEEETKRATFEAMKRWAESYEQPSAPLPQWALEPFVPADKRTAHAEEGSSVATELSRSPSRVSPPEDPRPTRAVKKRARTATSSSSTRVAEAAGEHACRWQGCGATFATTAELTAHLSERHVGSGKNRYICLWDGCSLDDAKPSKTASSATVAVGGQGKAGGGAEGARREFAQRQKIMRHLQAHTGDRPFTCETCGRAFGEMATLVQHQRTHTREKPFACPFPGCTKSFALASALTIHQRTHSGSRPFACPFEGCAAAFAESSNLTKHVRTHTGERPFRCAEPGCRRAFKRSDQLARHRKVHV